MSRTIPYDATRRALYTPCADAISLSGLATANEALLCAELARFVYCRFETDNTIAQAMRDELSGVGFSEVDFFNGSGMQALLAFDPNKQLAVLSFRGTQPDEVKDLLTNVKAVPSPWASAGCVHKGFADMLASGWDAIQAALSQRGSARLLYTGHSLGAALATLSAALQQPGAMVTFGSPRVGDGAFADSLAGVSHDRYVDCADLVCRIPPEQWSYEHVGTRRYIDRAGALQNGFSDADIRADQSSATLAYPLQYGWRQPANVFLRNFADHAPVNYIHALRTGI